MPRLFRRADEGSAPRDGKAPPRRLIAALRVGVFVALVAVALSFTDLGAVWDRLRVIGPVSLAAMIGLHVIIILLASWRFGVIARGAGASVPAPEARRLTFYSTLGNLVLPTSLAGDAGRIWLLRRQGIGLRGAIDIGIFDRVIGLAALGLLVLAGTLADRSFVSPLLTALVCALSLAGATALARRFGKARAPRLMTRTVALSLAAHLVSIAIAWIFLRDQGAPVSPAALLVLFPAVLLAASIPVSVGGWGTRDVAGVAAFSAIGMPADLAVAMTLSFGLTQLVAALAGSAFCFVLGPAPQDRPA